MKIMSLTLTDKDINLLVETNEYKKKGMKIRSHLKLSYILWVRYIQFVKRKI